MVGIKFVGWFFKTAKSVAQAPMAWIKSMILQYST
jgi:hypothetical protein